MTLQTFPPFPTDIPTHPLLIIDFRLLKEADEAEETRLWKAATELGFWYLKNHDADEEVIGMFEMGQETMKLPMEEKMPYEQGDDGSSFGYKAAGANAVDATGLLDTVEFINVAKDDALAWPKQARRTYPKPVQDRMASNIQPFVRKALDVNYTVLRIFNKRLGLPEGTLERLHPLEEFSGSETRCIRNPPNLPVDRVAIGGHTDFGSLSFLHNRLGGLQVFPPNQSEWQYVKPLPGHAICNVGDALALFSGGILRSNLHRVMPPPGAQANLERWSVVFFTRPGNSIELRALVDESALIADAVASNPGKNFETGSTAYEWFSRRIRNQRIKNRKGPETWMASRGTEGEVEVQ